jgi:translation initiation factor 2 subunit 2
MTSFEEMLTKVYSQLGELNQPQRKLVIPAPVIEASTTNTYWKNIKKILMVIDRPPDHFVEFLNKELKTGNWVSESKSDGLVLIGKFKIAQITAVLQEYVKRYVVCNICKSLETKLDKSKELRCYRVECTKCNSSYVV